jgi:hypothetical protein
METHWWKRTGACRGARRCHSGRVGSWWPNLSQKIRGVKLNGTRIVGGEPTDRKEIVGDVWGYENVVEIERSREHRGTY